MSQKIYSTKKTTEEQKEAVLDIFLNSMENQVHVIAEQVNISRHRVHKIINKHLENKKNYKV